MSQQSEQVEADAEESLSSVSVAERFEEYYHLPTLAILMIFMLWVRLQAYNRFASGDQVLFSGNDAYYHYRQVTYTVRHWPWTMPFDPWTRFPYGTSVGQFGTLFDQIIATAALIVGLGDPTTRQIALTTLVAPAVFGAFVALPVYALGDRLHSRPAGLFGVLVLAILPGTFLRRSTVGFADHHIAEALFMMTAIAATMVAVRVAERELPVYEQLLDRDWEGLKTPGKWAALAGVAISLYLWVWPPGVVLVGILGVYYAVSIPIEVVRGRRPDHLAFVAGISLGVLTLFSLVRLETLELSPTRPSLLQVVLPLAVAVGAVFLAALARLWDQLEIDRRAYPGGVLGLAILGALVLYVAVRPLYRVLVNQSLRAFGFGQGAATLTIAEAQPSPGVSPLDLGTLNSFFYQQYGLTYLVAIFGLCWLLANLYFMEDYRAEQLLVVVVAVFVVMMSLTQVRFHYYLAPVVAVLNAWTFGQVIDTVGLPSLTQRVGDMQGYQILTLLAVFVLVVAPLAPPLAAANSQQASQQGIPQFVVDAGGNTGPSGGIWAESGEWLQNNTPAPGNYNGSGNSMAYYGTYGETQDFQYPEGAYGIMAWWDYGHWITVTGERIPHANPFQQNARSASSFLQAASEERGRLILEAIPSLQGRLKRIDNMSNAELRGVVANQSAQEASENVRYVMIDDQTATTKFGAVTRWANPPGSSYFRQSFYSYSNQNRSVTVTNERFRQTMVSRLYYEDANGLEHFRLVHEAGRYTLVGGLTNTQFQESAPLITARRYGLAFNTWNSQVAQIDRLARTLERRGQVLNLGRLSPRLRGLLMYQAQVESLVKTYEYVPGAKVTGTLNVSDPANVTPVIQLQLRTSSGRNFNYTQQVSLDSEGQFTVTVPYSTNNAVKPSEGGTNLSVRAVGNYSMYGSSLALAFGGAPIEQFNVSEEAVYRRNGQGTIDLGTIEPPRPEGNQSDGGNGNQSGTGNDSNRSGSMITPTPGTTSTVGGPAAVAPVDGLGGGSSRLARPALTE